MRVTDFLEASARCETSNQFNRLHIDIENVAMPLDIAAIADLAASQDLPAPSRQWLDTLKTLSPRMFAAPQPFRRQDLHTGVTLYRDPAFAAADKDLLVAFGGHAGRLMLPIGVFLQEMDARLWDIVVLNKGAGGSYLNGMEGIGDDLAAIARFIETEIEPSRYRRVVLLGTSGGGYAAIAAAGPFNADRGVSICASAPASLPAPPSRNPGPAAAAGPVLVFLFGAENPNDRRSALALQAVFGGRLLPIAGVENHNVLHELLKQRRLAKILDTVLGADGRVGRTARLVKASLRRRLRGRAR